MYFQKNIFSAHSFNPYWVTPILAMSPLSIRSEDQSLSIFLDPISHRFEISGKADLPQTAKHTVALLEWVDDYVKQPNLMTIFRMHFHCFNPESLPAILDVLYQLETIQKRGGAVKIVWEYENDDDTVQEVGEDLAEMVSFPFEIRPFAPSRETLLAPV